MKTPAWGKVGQMDAASFFKTLAAALKANPPSDDGQMVAKMAKIGIIPGQDFDMSKLDPAVAKGLKGAPKAAQEKIMAHEKNASTMVNGWTFALNTGAYGTDYLQRAYITAVDLGANLPQDMLYPLTREDCKGEPLDGAHRYILHFPKGSNPAGQRLLVVDHV